MARDYGKVRAQFWDDDALRELSIEANYLALYLITSSHTNAIGCFRLPTAYILNDTRLDKKSLEKALAELRSTGYAIPCERVPWVFIPNFLRHNPPENPNVWRKCVKELEAIPAGISVVKAIAAELVAIATEDRMCREGNKTRVSDDELTRLKRFADGIETVSEPLEVGLRPIPSPNLTEPNLSMSAVADAFKDFWEAYPTDKNMSRKAAEAQWKRLTPEKRTAAIAAIPGFKAYCAANSWYRPKHADGWLAQERFEGYASEPPPDPEKLAALSDAVDRKLRRGKYAEVYS